MGGGVELTLDVGVKRSRAWGLPIETGVADAVDRINSREINPMANRTVEGKGDGLIFEKRSSVDSHQ